MTATRRAILTTPAMALAGSATAQPTAPAVMVEAGGRVAEADESNASVGYGGLPDRDGRVTLDACVMTWAGDIGAVCALEDIVHAVSVARRVMERTPHTMLVGEGARTFAVEQGFQPQNLLTPRAEAAWREWHKTANYAPRINSENSDWRTMPGGPGNHDTIGLLAIGTDQRMAGAFALQPGFTYAVTDTTGQTRIERAGALFA